MKQPDTGHETGVKLSRTESYSPINAMISGLQWPAVTVTEVIPVSSAIAVHVTYHVTYHVTIPDLKAVAFTALLYSVEKSRIY